MMNSVSLPVDLYGTIALSQAQRILSFGDREPESPTYGCFDRYFWHYRQVDFVNSRFQESSHFLALLYLYNHPENRFYQKSKVKEWTEAAVRFWAGIQVPDGSFNEYWPYERSFCVTSFTLYSNAEACRLLGLNPPEEAVRKACAWIVQYENTMVMNQMAASAAALLIGSLILNDAEIRQWANRRMERVLSLQHPEGYFAEYGGWDIGYLSITLSCLAQFYIHTQEPRISEAMQRGFEFLLDKIEPNGTFDYNRTSRHTQYFYPYGFRVMKQWDLLSRHLRGLEKNEVINPSWFDDRYCLPLAIDYLQTGHYHWEESREAM